MALWLKQSTAAVISFGPFLDKTDGVTLEDGLVSALDHATTGIMLSKNGGALTIRHQNVTASTYDAHGNYLVTLDATDTNTLGRLRIQWTAPATCLPVWQDVTVLAANVYNWLFGTVAPATLTNVTDIEGTGFVKDTHSLVNRVGNDVTMDGGEVVITLT